MTERKNRAIKYCAYSLLLLLLYILQTSRGTSVSVFGIRPDVIPFFVAAAALFDGPYAGGLFGFFAGLLCAVSSPAIDGLSALYLGVAGTVCGVVSQRYMRKVLPSALLLGTLIVLVQGVLSYVFYYALLYSAPLGYSAAALLGQCALSLAPGAAVYWAVRAMYLRFAEKDEA